MVINCGAGQLIVTARQPAEHIDTLSTKLLTTKCVALYKHHMASS